MGSLLDTYMYCGSKIQVHTYRTLCWPIGSDQQEWGLGKGNYNMDNKRVIDFCWKWDS